VLTFTTAVKFYKIEMRVIYNYLWARNFTTALMKLLWCFSGICFEILREAYKCSDHTRSKTKKIVVG